MTVSDAKIILQEVREYFFGYPEPVKVYIHWTAGDYTATFDDYHFCITGDGDIHNTRDLRRIPAATWQRNEGSIAIALCCAKGAMAYKDNPNYARLGAFPPTAAQIETCAALMAAIADVFGISIDISHFMTHAEAADNLDGVYCHAPYGPDNGCERWDLAVLKDDDAWGAGGDILRQKAAWYLANGGRECVQK